MRRYLWMCLWMWSGCSGEASPPRFEPAVPDAPDLRLELVYAAALGDGRVEVGGLDGAAEAGAGLRIEDQTVVADAHGRFRLHVPGAAGDEIAVSTEARPDDRWAFRARDPATARAAMVHPPLPGGAGDVPNDLLFFDDGRALLVRSGDQALSVFDAERGIEAGVGVRLPPSAVPHNPWFAAIVDARTVAVTAQTAHAVYLIDVELGTITRTLRPPVVPLGRTFALSRPKDLDGDGAPESAITEVRPRAPQGIAVAGRRLVAAFSGFVDTNNGAAVPAVFVPGVVASWSLDDLDAPPVTRVTPALDPQEVTAIGGDVLVTMSGAVAFQGSGSGRITTSSGAVDLLDATTLDLLAHWPMGDFSPTSAVIAGDALWVSSLARAVVRALPLDGGEPLAELRLNEDMVDSVFRWIPLPGGLLGAGSFNSDRLHVIDPRERTIDRIPFGAPIAVGPGRPLFDGLQIVARRPGRAGVDFVGADVFAMMKASRIVPIETRKVMGP